MRTLPNFRDTSLFERAMTHRSYLNEHPEMTFEDNQRLEFLGDAVLDFIVGAWLYNRFPELREGRLTSLRAALVNTDTLAQFALSMQLDEYLRLGKGESEAGGRGRTSMLADAFEALLGALYLDQGLAAVQAYVEQMLPEEIDRILADERDRDAKSILQEWSQAERGITPRYYTIDERGPDHAKIFNVEVRIGNKVMGRGEGRSKQAAAQAAAAEALKKLNLS
jgi:ribonuclease-3